MRGVTVVVPTLGRPSLGELLRALAAGGAAELGPELELDLLVVDDRPDRERAAPLPVPPELAGRTRVLPGRAAGPAAARNVGWRAARCDWVVFLDDDVVPEPDWLSRLAADLRASPQVGGVQGRVRVPLPGHRRPTDWERNTAGLATGRWITADMAYRWAALAAVGGFDERFPRAYREDAELAFRVAAAGWRLRAGQRRVTHPVRPERRWVSLRAQRGNADDALLRRLYGPGWRTRLGAPPGRRAVHAAVTVAGAVALSAALVAAVARPPARAAAGAAAVVAGAGWLAGTGEFAWRRVRPGPRDPGEVAVMVLTSAAIPPLACLHWLRGWWGARGARHWRG